MENGYLLLLLALLTATAILWGVGVSTSNQRPKEWAAAVFWIWGVALTLAPAILKH